MYFSGKIKLNEFGWIKPEAQVIIPYWNVISSAATDTMLKTIINLEQNFFAKTTIEIPNGTEHAEGDGDPDLKSCQTKVTNSKLNVNDLTFQERYSKAKEELKRREINKETENMSLLERLNYLNENI